MSGGLFDLGGRRALITGSSQGIGFALAHGLAKAGAALVLNGRDADKLQAAAKALRDQGLQVETLPFDVTDMPPPAPLSTGSRPRTAPSTS